MQLRATSRPYRGRRYEGTVVAGQEGNARLVVAGIILTPADCSAHGFIAEAYTAAEIEALEASGYAIATSSNGQ